MNKTVIAILLTSISFLMQSCQKENLGTKSQSEGVAVINIGIGSESVHTKASALTNAENSLKTLRIFAFGSDGALDVTKLITCASPLTNTAREKIEVSKDSRKQLYIVANEPNELTSTLEAIETIEELKDINFAIADAMNSGFNGDASFEVGDFTIPMSGNTLVNATDDCSINIALYRAVARVDLMIDKNSAAESNEVKFTDQTTFSVNGVNLNGYLFAQQTAIDPAEKASITTQSSEVVLDVEANKYTTSKRALTLYVAEQNYDISNPNKRIEIGINKIMVDGEYRDIKNKIVLGNPVVSSPLNEITRNWCYKIYATYSGVKNEITADEFVIVDWQYKELDGEIEGVMMALESTVEMDWLRNGNSYKNEPAGFGSNKPIEILLPTFNGEYNADGTPILEYTPYPFVQERGRSYELTTLGLENSFIEQTNWIAKATLVFTSDRTGYIEYTYKPKAVHFSLIDYPIRFKSDNVVKQMDVIYDNGYIPNSFLPPYWSKRAPNGIIFAKRGRGKHPRDTKEVFYPDKDGFYRGEHQTTALTADEYCKQELGDKWYVPSKEDMAAIVKGVTELGSSYRLQNNGKDLNSPISTVNYWTSSEDSDIAGNYWAGNLELKDNMVDGSAPWIISLPGSESHYVRCVFDL